MVWKARGTRTALAGLAATLVAGLLAGCGSSGEQQPDKRITVWTQENLPPRMAATKKVVRRFEKESGVHVDLVGVDEAQLPQLIMSAAAAGKLPDVIGAVPLGQVWQMYGNGLLHTDVTRKIVADLGPKTFRSNALSLTADGDKRLAVPSDAWLQLLVYRKDLFAKAGLKAPTSYASALKAAAKLDKGGMDGMSLATDPSDVFTQQSFEDLALANGCRLVNDKGEATLDSPACRTSFKTYDTLAREHGAPGTQSVDTTRATYFAGRSAMMVWSSFLLDELAGLRSDALPSCPQCKKDPDFLARNTGIVTALQGPDAQRPAQFGEITSWAVTRTAETAASRSFVDYMMGKGYADWFGMAPEGKIPVRNGTPKDPDVFRTAWREADMGVDKKRSLKQAYPDGLTDQLLDGIKGMRRWGLTEGQGILVGATNGELPVAKAIGAMTGGQESPDSAVEEANSEVEALRKSLQ
ncbi:MULTISPECIES: ABC transporter substrate-binding protein [Streptomyces]|uniref:Extracellular solute-binding protein n=1 Tax=Streptomyces evansiae TaxID=3075535 RepID=A0ABU2QWT2_9ACTN|nr:MULTISPECIES: extracellular solute-binding protein [unclassified Streptomyces]MDT0408304.1 extracellular solute-binding protein [Streptomyces sp. DSM 41979]MYQ57736.1 extracellular solute-binding protein [Streptomyces sp. SID4926]SCE33244.1 carbohydrate ABC transporter substrate-binding protein, CUT1 family [Streptomyces sp. DfronAA-171]